MKGLKRLVALVREALDLTRGTEGGVVSVGARGQGRCGGRHVAKGGMEGMARDQGYCGIMGGAVLWKGRCGGERTSRWEERLASP